MPSFIDQFILKVHGGCNLACDHCYIYEHADQSWRDKPQTMTPAVTEQVGIRIAEHAIAHRLPMVRILIHGGEPLLLGISRMREILSTLHGILANRVALSLHVQTNGVTLSERFCRLFDEYGVQVGISLDGDRSANDRHRRSASGRSSHAKVLRALALLRRAEFRHLYGGILCTVDVANDPISVYEALLAQSPPHLDFLFPHATWANPPPGHGEVPAPYAAWLGRIHSRWLVDGRPVPIRLFDALAAASRGEPSGSEAVGLKPVTLTVVDTDGSWEQADSLKTAYAGAPATGMSVFTHSVDSLMSHPGVSARNEGYAVLCATCMACPVVRTCGGGLYAHRYRQGNGFDNPSVYCADLLALAVDVTAAQAKAIGASRTSIAGASPRLVTHELPTGAFDAFAAGAGTAEGAHALRAMQLSQTRVLIAGMPLSVSRSDLGTAASLGRDLLMEIDSRHPAETTEVLSHPFVQRWAIRCLRPDDAADHERDRAHIAGVAAAIAWRAGLKMRLPLPVRAGLAQLPGVGASRVRSEGPTAIVSLEGADRPSGEWLKNRRLTASSLPVAVEDLDPYRTERDGPPAHHRLSTSEWDVWRTALTHAATDLAQLVPDYAAVMRAGLRAVVPLRTGEMGHDDPGHGAQHAFGGVGVGVGVGVRVCVGRAKAAVGSVVTDLAPALLCEFQHTKLAALLDAYEFFAPAKSSSVTVPWRPAPLPVKHVLHALYTRVALAELWRARSASPPPHPATPRRALDATAVFRQYLNWADITVDALAAEGALAPDGIRFAAGLRGTIDRLAATKAGDKLT